MQLNAIWIQWYDTQLWNAKIDLLKFRCQLQQNFLLKFIYLYSPSWRNDHLRMGQKIGICIPLICFKIDINYALANSAISNRKAKEKYVILIIWNNCWLRIIDLEYMHISYLISYHYDQYISFFYFIRFQNKDILYYIRQLKTRFNFVYR